MQWQTDVMLMPQTSPSLAGNKPFFSPPTVNTDKPHPPKEELLKKENKEETEEVLPEIQTKLSFDGLPPPLMTTKLMTPLRYNVNAPTVKKKKGNAAKRNE
jgi:hypothetical protein